MSEPLYEIVPNLSEGRDASAVDAFVAAIEGEGVRVIDRTSDATHHRSVITAVGGGEDVVRAGVALAGEALARIDLRAHRGVHPRIGALDVLPFVPLRGATMAACVRLAHAAGERIWEQHRIPSYYYGAARLAPERAPLAAIRKHAGSWAPDVGDALHEGAGAIAIGAREILIAFNVELATADLTVALAIAKLLRERAGGLRTLRTLGLRLTADRVQVSVNVTDYRATPLYRVTELVRKLAADRGVAIVRSELIGLAPREAIEVTARYYAGLRPGVAYPT
ncbi:MAG TPA: glutamate formimidoyltransferase [Candidatus Acidoferrales bacterium]|nr:glutamate formimidoyltransferase [Candidatus Acidoferrales bacterium]